MNDDLSQRAIWIPGWFELDQPLEVGVHERYWFFENPPEEDAPQADSYDLMFFNRLTSETNCVIRQATVVEISHPELGQFRRIDTDGLDYVFYPLEGDQPLIVNAEEEPGMIYDRAGKITDWTMHVVLSNVSEPVAGQV